MRHAVSKLQQLYNLWVVLTRLIGFLKCYTYSALHTCVFPQTLSYKTFSFCDQILKIGANDASGKMLQSAL